MNKCTLIIDGNWLLMSRMYTQDGFQADNLASLKEQASKALADVMAMSISGTLYKLDSIVDNAILVTDSNSWRKDLEVPTALEGVTYKGNRVKSDDVDWLYIYQSLDYLSDRCESLGMTVCRATGVEGDDWIWHWTKKLNEEGINAIIWSSDKDLKQLTNINNGSWTLWYNDRNTLSCTKAVDMEDVCDELSFFMADARDLAQKMIIENIAKNLSMNVEYITPDDVVMEKIVCGDKSDNIKSINSVVSGGRTYSVTEKMWNEVKESLDIKNLEEFFSNRDNIIKGVSNLKKFKNSILTSEDIGKIFDYNTQLVWLHKSKIPQHIQDAMDDVEYKEANINEIKGIYESTLGTQPIADLFD